MCIRDRAKAIIMAGGRLDGRAVEAVIAEKKQIIRKSGLLEFYDTSETLTDVGGLDVLKEWLRKRVRAFSAEARAFGLPEPVSYTHLRAHETVLDLVCRLLLEKKTYFKR